MYSSHNGNQRGIVGEIIARFEKVGLKIVGSKMINASTDHLHHHYETIGQVISRRGEATFNQAVAMMQEGPVLAFALEGVEAAHQVKKMVGPTEPKAALPGTIRGDYSHLSFAHGDKVKSDVYNIIHCSGDFNDAVLEVPHWFAENELFLLQHMILLCTRQGRINTPKKLSAENAESFCTKNPRR